MPLEEGKSRQAVSRNIQILREEGYSKRQAAAIALRRANFPNLPVRRQRNPG